jgi:DNA-binding beta-propeller fold protein YncE
MKLKFYSGLSVIAIFLLLFISCSPKLRNSSTKESIIYPAPPDTARIQYLTRISSSKDIAPKQSAFAKTVIGKEKVLSIYKPYGLFMRNGKLYVCDVSIGGLEIIDFENKEFNYFIPDGQYRLKLPINCYVDTNDQLYIADVTLQKIMVFDSIGKYVTSFGKKENVKPTDVFVYGNKIYVPDANNNRVNVYKKDTYEFAYYFPKSEKGDDSFLYKPTNIFVDENRVYVSDMGNGRVQIFTHEGEYLSAVGKYGKNIGELVRPKGIAVDREGNLYVVDASFENVQIFDNEGKLLLFFGGSYKGPGDLWLPTKVNIDYDNLRYFEKYVDPKFELEYLIFVANQFGPDKINVYGRIVPVKGEKNSKK